KCGQDPLQRPAAVPAAEKEVVDAGPAPGMTVMGQRDGGAPEVRRGEAGGGTGIASAVKRPRATSDGAGPDAAKRAEQGAAGDAGTAPAGLGAAAGGEPGIGAALKRPRATSDGAGTDAAPRAAQDAAGNAGTALTGLGAAAGGGAGIGAGVQRAHATSDGGTGGLGDRAVPRRMAGTSPA